MDRPNTGLPEVIQNILDTLLDTHFIRTWNIFHEENSEITVRLKLTSRHFESPSSKPPVVQNSSVSTASYKRKSANQIARDKERSLIRRRRFNNSGSFICCSTQTENAQHAESPIETDRKQQLVDSPVLNRSLSPD